MKHKKSLKDTQNSSPGLLVKIFFSWIQSIKLEKVTSTSNEETELQDFKKHEKTRNMTTLKEHNNFSIINSKEIKIYKIRDK